MSEYIPPTLERSGSTSIAVLRDRHRDSTAYVVGKGPSIANLRASDFGPGPVIVINEAILPVQVLGLPNHIYSMQRDGCEVEDAENTPRPCGSCEPLGWQRAPLVNPYPGIAVVFSQHLSSWCLHGRANRFVIPVGEFSDNPWNMSVLEAIPFARHLGAASIVMVCFDSLTTGEDETFVAPVFNDDARQARMKANIAWVKPRVFAALRDIPHSFFSPIPPE